jgi:hypothetical protein
VRYLGIIGVIAAAIATQVYADNVKKPCVGLREESDYSVHADERKDLLLTDEQCEAAKRQEFRLKLFEIPQEDEDPMALSLGAKQGGGILRFKIPFSF